MTSHAFRHHCM